MIGRCPVPNSLTAYAHFAARLGSFFIEPDVLKDVPFDNTATIYLINLLKKLELRFKLESEMHYFSICHWE